MARRRAPGSVPAMSYDDGMSRTQFLTRAAALGAAAALPSGLATTAARALAAPPPPPGLTYRGVGYEVIDGETPRTGWDATRMRADVATIATELHANSLTVFGTGVERLIATATEAVGRGLHVCLQPRLADVPPREILDHLAEAGRQADELRRQGARIHLSVGAEFLLFTPGIVPGDDVLERIANLTAGRVDYVAMQRRLTAFIARAATAGRAAFGGELTYGAAHGDEVDWRQFDIVSVDYYGFHTRRSAYERDLRPYLRHGKPVAIAEFGACTYKGAARRGGMGWDVVDYSGRAPRIKGDLVRSERAQARYLVDVLDVFEALGLYSATVYQFVTPDAPHRARPREDLDLASYAIVKPIWASRSRPGAWRWERKAAFGALAARYAAAAATAKAVPPA